MTLSCGCSRVVEGECGAMGVTSGSVGVSCAAAI